MINLLSILDQKTIKNIYHYRLLEWYSLLLACLLVILLVLAGSLYFIITLRVDTEQSILDSLQIKNSDGSTAARLSVADINKAITLMVQSTESPRLADLINTLAVGTPVGIKITNLKFTRTDKGEVVVDLKGVTANRQILLGFTSLLEGLGGFHEVNSPYSNLVKKTNAEFNISLTVAKVKTK